MEYALKERIGKPELFTGRKEEKSQSRAILARRKSRQAGKRIGKLLYKE